jgi:hypothetical protein
MGSFTTRLDWETLRSIDSATLSGSYQTVGTPLLYPSYILKMVNNSTALVTISKDGVNDIDVLPANSFWLYDLDTSGNPAPESVPKGTQIFVKGATPGVGLIYLVSIYIVEA